MKCDREQDHWRRILSLPVRGAWVEIIVCKNRRMMTRSLPVRGAWVEIGAMIISGV